MRSQRKLRRLWNHELGGEPIYIPIIHLTCKKNSLNRERAISENGDESVAEKVKRLEIAKLI